MKSKTQKRFLIIPVTFCLLITFCFVSMFQTFQAVAVSLNLSSADLTIENAAYQDVKNEKDYTAEAVYTSEDIFSEPEYDKTEIVAEDTSKRTETSKTFVRSDGTYVLQEYGSAVHYFDGNVYSDIDNTLDEKLVSTANSFSVSFNDGSRKDLVSITDEEGRLSMTPIETDFYKSGKTYIYAYDSSKNIRTVSHSEKTLIESNITSDSKEVVYSSVSRNFGVDNKNQKNLQVPEYRAGVASAVDSLNIKNSRLKESLSKDFSNDSSAVLYENIFESVDFQYILEGQDLKENIIVNAPLSEYIFKFELNLKNLVAYKAENGDILITDTKGELVYTIPKGYMYDAAGNSSYDVEYELDFDEDGGIILTVVADKAFFDAAVFPVVIDPSITKKQGDMTVGHHDQNNSNLELDHFSIHSHGALFWWYRYNAFISLGTQTISDAIKDKVVKSAELKISFNDGTGKTFVPMIKSNTAFSNADPVLYDLFYSQNNTQKLLTINVSNYVTDYLGQAVISIKDTAGKDTNFSDAILTINYEEPAEDYNIIQDMGSGGSGFVDLNDGSLGYTFDSVVTNDGFMPITLSHVYNYDNGFPDYGVGYGFKLNFHQEVVRGGSPGNYSYYYKNAEGKKYYFYKDKIYQNKQLGLKLYQNSSTGVIRLIDGQGNSMVFNSGGDLIQIHQYPSRYEAPKNSMMIAINWSASGDRIETITNNFTTLELQYGMLSTLVGIADQNTNTQLAEYEYWGFGELTKVKRYLTPNIPSITELYYDSSSLRLNKVVNDTGERVEYSYIAGNSGKVVEIITGNDNSNINTENTVDIAYVNNTGSTHSIDDSVILSSEDRYFRHVSFKNNKMVTDYAYEKKPNGEILPAYATGKDSATSKVFDYLGFIDTYANTRDVYYDEEYRFFSTSTTISLPLTPAAVGERFQLSMWVKSSWAATLTLKARLPLSILPGWDKHIVEFSTNDAIDDWQFVTMLWETEGAHMDILTLRITAGVETSLIRLMHLPKEQVQDAAAVFSAEYDSKARLLGFYQKNTADNTILKYEYVYGDASGVSGEYPGQITSITQYSAPASVTTKAQFNSSRTQKNKVVYTYSYSSRILTAITNYGTSSTYSLSSCTYDTLGRITSETDTNRIVTTYRYNSDGTVTTGTTGATGSPSVTGTDQYYEGSGLLKSTNTGGTVTNTGGVTSVSGGITTNFGYEDYGALKTINHNGFDTSFEYHLDGSLESVSVPGATLVSYDSTQTQDTVTYGNGQSVSYNYNSDDTLTSITNSDNSTTTFGYNSKNELSSINDASGVTYGYMYNYELQPLSMGHVNLQYSMTNGNNSLVTHYSGADNMGNRTGTWYYYNGALKDISNLTYNSQGQLSRINHPDSAVVYTYDAFGRMTGKKILKSGVYPFSNTYTYQSSGSVTKNLPSTSQFTANGTASYKYYYHYFANGNLASMNRGSPVYVSYTYDEYDRLHSESNFYFGKDWSYYYDNGGNITSRYEWNRVTGGAWTKTHEYNYNSLYKDRLDSISINGSNYIFAYDNAGNPINYMGKTMTWQNGRELKSINSNISYKYDYSGLRTQKNVNDISTYYLYEGSNLIAETTQGVTTWYYYDESGVSGFEYMGVKYIYEKNMLGDIVGIYRVSDGEYMGGYNYDAWGRILNPTDIENNPILQSNLFRYRSYYYDNETKFYYLNSRYYDPSTGRFLNADDPTMLYDNASVAMGANLYAYCLNNPIMYTDSSGYGVFLDIIMSAVPGSYLSGIDYGEFVIPGVDPVLMHYIDSLLQVGLGIGMMFLPGAQYLGAGIIGAGVGGIIGGHISEAVGGTFSQGYAIGNFVGGFVGGGIKGIASGIKAMKVARGINIVGTKYSILRPTQDYIYRNTVNKYVKQLNAGKTLKRIEVASVRGNLYILDGHHRYVASMLTGKPIGMHITYGGPVGMPNWLNVFWM